MRRLTEARHWPGLVELDLGHGGFGSAGSRALASSPYLTNLARLSVRWSILGRPGLRALRERFGERLEV